MKRLSFISFLILLGTILWADYKEPFELKDYGKIKISGPYTHKNLALYLIHRVKKIENQEEFIILEEGLKQKLVKVSECKGAARVPKLEVKNLSDKPLFLQPGDILKGGKQDRTVRVSLIIPPKSSQIVDVFCVEPGRWRGKRGFCKTIQANALTRSMALAVRQKAEQTIVWKEVQRLKEQAKDKADVKIKGTSLVDVLEHKNIKKLVDEFVKKLGKLAQEKPDSIGMAYAIDGEFHMLNIYPNHKLFEKLYPKLLYSCAIEAILKKKGKKEEKIDYTKLGEIIVNACQSLDKKDIEVKTEKFVSENELRSHEDIKNVYFQQRYKGKAQHVQIIKK
jgi:hypothetical protein